MSMPQLLVILSGEEGSGKSYALKFFADKLTKKGLNVVTIPEDTTPFYGDGVKTYDQFCKLPPDERRAKSFEVLKRRVKLEEEFLFSDKYPDDKTTCIILDRPWWDTFYYSLRRSVENGQEELGPFDLLAMLYLSGFNLTYPEHCLTIVYNFLPLAPKFLTTMEDDSKHLRPKRVTKDSCAEQLHRLKWYVNYNIFLASFVQQLLVTSPKRWPFVIVNELSLLELTPELKKLVTLKVGDQDPALTVPAEDVIRTRYFPMNYEAGGKNINDIKTTEPWLITEGGEQILLMRECVRLAESGMLTKPFSEAMVKGLTKQILVPNAIARDDNLHTLLNMVLGFLAKFKSMASDYESTESGKSSQSKKIQEGDPDMMRRLFNIASKGGTILS